MPLEMQSLQRPNFLSFLQWFLLSNTQALAHAIKRGSSCPSLWFYNIKSTEINFQEHMESINYYKFMEETQTVCFYIASSKGGIESNLK